MTGPELLALVDVVAVHRQLPEWTYRGVTFTPGELLGGLCFAESGGNPNARRYEPHQDLAGRTDAATDPDRPGIDDGPAEDDASYGLCQVMGSTWRRMIGAPVRTSLKFELLFDPLIGLSAGSKYLADELALVRRLHPDESQDRHVERALARYNGGPSGDDIDESGDLRRRVYVDLVASRAARIKASRAERGHS